MYQEIMKKSSATKQAPGLHTSPHKLKVPNKHSGHSTSEFTSVGNVNRNSVHDNQCVTKPKDITPSYGTMNQDIAKLKPKPFELKTTICLKPFNESKNHSSQKVCDSHSQVKNNMDSSTLDIKSGISPLVYYGKNSTENSMTSSNRSGKQSTLESKVTPLSLIVSQRNCVLQKRREDRQSFEDMLLEVEDNRTQELIKKKLKRSARSNNEKRTPNAQTKSSSPEEMLTPRLKSGKTLEHEDKSLLNKPQKSQGIDDEQGVHKSDNRKSDLERLPKPLVEIGSVVETKIDKNDTCVAIGNLVEPSKQTDENTRGDSNLNSSSNVSSKSCHSPLNVSERKKPSKQTLRTQVIDHQRLFHYCLRKNYRLKHTNWNFQSDIEMKILKRKYQSLQIMFPRSLSICLKRFSLDSFNHSGKEKSSNKKASVCSEVLPRDVSIPDSVQDNEQIRTDSLVDPRVISLSKTLLSHKNGKVGLQKTFKSHVPLAKSKVLEKSSKPIINKKPDWTKIKEKLKAVSSKSVKVANDGIHLEKNGKKISLENQKQCLKKTSYNSFPLTHSNIKTDIPKLTDTMCANDSFTLSDEDAPSNCSSEIVTKTGDREVSMETDDAVVEPYSLLDIDTCSGIEKVQVIGNEELENSFHYDEQCDNIFDKVASKMSGNNNKCDDIGEAFDVIPDLYAEREQADINDDISADISPPVLEKAVNSPSDVENDAVDNFLNVDVGAADSFSDVDYEAVDSPSDVGNEAVYSPSDYDIEAVYSHSDVNNEAFDTPSDVVDEKHMDDNVSDEVGKDTEQFSTPGPVYIDNSDDRDDCSVNEKSALELEDSIIKNDDEGLDLNIENICSISEFHAGITSNENESVDESIEIKSNSQELAQSEIENETSGVYSIEYGNELNERTEIKVGLLGNKTRETGKNVEVRDNLSEQTDDKLDPSNCDVGVTETKQPGTIAQDNTKSDCDTEEYGIRFEVSSLNNIDEILELQSSVNNDEVMIKGDTKGISESGDDCLTDLEKNIDDDSNCSDDNDGGNGNDNDYDKDNKEDYSNGNGNDADGNDKTENDVGNDYVDDDADTQTIAAIDSDFSDFDTSDRFVEDLDENSSLDDTVYSPGTTSEDFDDSCSLPDIETTTVQFPTSDHRPIAMSQVQLNNGIRLKEKTTMEVFDVGMDKDCKAKCNLPSTVSKPRTKSAKTGEKESSNDRLVYEFPNHNWLFNKYSQPETSETSSDSMEKKLKTVSPRQKKVYSMEDYRALSSQKLEPMKSSLDSRIPDCLKGFKSEESNIEKLTEIELNKKNSNRLMNTSNKAVKIKVNPVKCMIDINQMEGKVCTTKTPQTTHMKEVSESSYSCETVKTVNVQPSKCNDSSVINVLIKDGEVGNGIKTNMADTNLIDDDRSVACYDRLTENTTMVNEKTENVNRNENKDIEADISGTDRNKDSEAEINRNGSINIEADTVNRDGNKDIEVDYVNSAECKNIEASGSNGSKDMKAEYIDRDGNKEMESDMIDKNGSIDIEIDNTNKNYSVGIKDNIVINGGKMNGDNSDKVEDISECASEHEQVVNKDKDESAVNNADVCIPNEEYLSLDANKDANDDHNVHGNDDNENNHHGDNNDDDNENNDDDNDDDNGEDSKLVIDELNDDQTTSEPLERNERSETVVNESQENNERQNIAVKELPSEAVDSVSTDDKTSPKETKQVHENKNQHKEINVLKPETTEVNFRPRTKPLVQLVHPQVYKPLVDTVTDSQSLIQEVQRSANAIFPDTEVPNPKLGHMTWTSPASSPVTVSRVPTCMSASPVISISTVCHQTLASLSSHDSQVSKCLTDSYSMLTTTVSSYGNGLVLPVQPFLQNVNNDNNGDIKNVKQTEEPACNNDITSSVPEVQATSENLVDEMSMNKSHEQTLISQPGNLPVQKCLNSRPHPLLPVPKTSVPPMQASRPSNIATMVPAKPSVYPVSTERTQLENCTLSDMKDKCSTVKSVENDSSLSGGPCVEDDVDDEIKRQMEELDAEIKRKQREQEEMRKKKLMLLEKMKQAKANNTTKQSDVGVNSSNYSTSKEPLETKVTSEESVGNVEQETYKYQSLTNKAGNSEDDNVNDSKSCNDIVLTALAKSGQNLSSNMRTEKHKIFNEIHSVTVTDGVISITETSEPSEPSEVLCSDDSLLDLALSTNISVTDSDTGDRSENLIIAKDTKECKQLDHSLKDDSMNFIEDIRVVNPFTGTYDASSEVEADSGTELDLTMPSKTILHKNKVDNRSSDNSEMNIDSKETSISNEAISNLQSFNSNQELDKKLSDCNKSYSDNEYSATALNLTKVSNQSSHSTAAPPEKVEQDNKPCTSVSTSTQLTVTSTSKSVPSLNLPVPSSTLIASNFSHSSVPSSVYPALSSTSVIDCVSVSSTVINTPVSTWIENLSMKDNQCNKNAQNAQSNVTLSASIDLTISNCEDQNTIKKSSIQNVRDNGSTDEPLNLTHTILVSSANQNYKANLQVSKCLDYTSVPTVSNSLSSNSSFSDHHVAQSTIPICVHNNIDHSSSVNSSSVMSLVNMTSKGQSSDTIIKKNDGKRPSDINISNEHLSPSKVMYLQDKPVSVESVNGVMRLASPIGAVSSNREKRKRARTKLVEIKAAHSRSPPKKMKITKPEPAHNQRSDTVEIMRKLSKSVCQVPLTICQSSPHFRRLVPNYLSPRECTKPFPKMYEKRQPRPAHIKRPFGIAGHLIVNAMKKRRRGLSTSSLSPPKFYSLPTTPTTPPCVPPRASSASEADENLSNMCALQSDKLSETGVSVNPNPTGNRFGDDDFPIKAHCRPKSSTNKDKFYETSVLRPPSMIRQSDDLKMDQSNVIDLTTEVIVVNDDERKVVGKSTKEREKVIQDELHYAMSRRQRTESEDNKSRDSGSTVEVPVEKISKTNPKISEAEVIRKTFAMPPPPYTGRQRMPVLAQFPRRPPLDQPRLENKTQLHPQVYVRRNLSPVVPRMQYISKGVDSPAVPRMQYIPRGVEVPAVPRMQYIPTGVESPVVPRMQYVPSGTEAPVVPRMQYVPKGIQVPNEVNTVPGNVPAQNQAWTKSPPYRNLQSDQQFGNKVVLDPGVTHGAEQIVAFSKQSQETVYPGNRIMSSQPVLHSVNTTGLQPNSRLSPMEHTASMTHCTDTGKVYPGTYIKTSQYNAMRHSVVNSQPQQTSVTVTNPQLLHGSSRYPVTSYKTQVHQLLQKPKVSHQGMIHDEDMNIQLYQQVLANSQSPKTRLENAHSPQMPVSFGHQIDARQYTTQGQYSDHPQHGHLTHNSYSITNRGNVPGMTSPSVPSPQMVGRGEFPPTVMLPGHSPVLTDVEYKSDINPQTSAQGRSQGNHTTAQPRSGDLQSIQLLTEEQKLQSMQRIRANHIRNQQLHGRTQANNLQTQRFQSPIQQQTGVYNVANPSAQQISNFKIQQIQSTVSSVHVPTNTQIQQLESPIHANYNTASSNHSSVSPRSVHPVSQAQQIISVQGHNNKGQGQHKGYAEVNQDTILAQNRSQIMQSSQNFVPAQVVNRQPVQGRNQPNSKVSRNEYIAVQQGKTNLVPTEAHTGHGRQNVRVKSDQGHLLNVQGRQGTMVSQNLKNPTNIVSHQHGHSSDTNYIHNHPILPKPSNQRTNLVASELPVSMVTNINPLSASHQDIESKYSPKPLSVQYSPQSQFMSNQGQGQNLANCGQNLSNQGQSQNLTNLGQGQNMPSQGQNVSSQGQSLSSQGQNLSSQGQNLSNEGEVKCEDESDKDLPHLQQVHGECFMCGKYSLYLCSNCKQIWYCSPECQLTHWQTHAAECLGPSS